MKRGLVLLLGILVMVALWFMVPLILISVNVFYHLPVVSNIYLRALGFVFFILGLSTTLYSVHEHLLTGRVTPVAVEPPKKFINRGFYGYSRNPMYLAILATFLGAFMILGYFLLFVYFLLAIPALHLFVVFKEEPELKKKFGKEYTDYTKEVPRWLSLKYRLRKMFGCIKPYG